MVIDEWVHRGIAVRDNPTTFSKCLGVRLTILLGNWKQPSNIHLTITNTKGCLGQEIYVDHERPMPEMITGSSYTPPGQPDMVETIMRSLQDAQIGCTRETLEGELARCPSLEHNVHQSDV